ncbi:glycine dehydrogenase [Trichuris suis]|nr:glycine dehydrogenase [Trichuris suis]
MHTLRNILLSNAKRAAMNSFVRFSRSARVTALPELDSFACRHIGPSEQEQMDMLATLGCTSLEELTNKAVPASIRSEKMLNLPGSLGRWSSLNCFKQMFNLLHADEREVLKNIRKIASMNNIWRSYIGMGFYDCILPSVIRRNIFENFTWLTSYTPYQPEIAQGRLESLMNFQTMVCEMTAMHTSNASLLDEATACAEAMQLCERVIGRRTFLVDKALHPQNIAVCQTRARYNGICLKIVEDWSQCDLKNVSGVLVQYPDTNGSIVDFEQLASEVHRNGGLFVVATDLLACALVRPPGEFGADIAVGSAQRFGLPLGYGGPHAAFFAVSNRYKKGSLIRAMPGRIVGLSRDSSGDPAFRLALQTREQHIRRGKATSNICTSQALLANMAAMYAVYHGPKGIRRIAQRVHNAAAVLAEGLSQCGYSIAHEQFFDTVKVTGLDAASIEQLQAKCISKRINLRYFPTEPAVAMSMDETVEDDDVSVLMEIFGTSVPPTKSRYLLKDQFQRKSDFLKQPVFNSGDTFMKLLQLIGDFSFHSEQMFMRYVKQLQGKDVSLVDSAIPLGSCTMKLNSAIQLTPCSWPEFSNIHPYVPLDQVDGYCRLFADLNSWFCEVTGFNQFSFQPNSGAQGEYTGLLCVKTYLCSKGEQDRTICLIPDSAHGTNPASCRMAGFTAVNVATDRDGNIDWHDLRSKVEQNGKQLGCMMITYPSTFGLFDERIVDICDLIHSCGGQVYLDGANMNAQVGLCRPGDYGFDVAHLNLHKTFCIPHGGGGPGMGPIGVKEHLIPFLPSHPLVGNAVHTLTSCGTVSACHWGSASILPIPWIYIASMGAKGLRTASQVAILNANYMSARLRDHYRILYRGSKGFVAHEFLLDCREFKKTAGIEVVDIAKRLMDYGFHAPTVSFPVSGCLMIEPTESEDKQELDRMCEALINIRKEIASIETGEHDRANNVLKMAPHTIKIVCGDKWDRPYLRSLASYPAEWSRRKVWPAVSRIDEPYGDTNLVCTLSANAE